MKLEPFFINNLTKLTPSVIPLMEDSESSPDFAFQNNNEEGENPPHFFPLESKHIFNCDVSLYELNGMNRIWCF